MICACLTGALNTIYI